MNPIHEFRFVGRANRGRNGRLSARDLIRVIGCGLRGAGSALTDAEVASLSVPGGLPAYVRIAADLLAATFGDPPEPDKPANPPGPQDA